MPRSSGLLLGALLAVGAAVGVGTPAHAAPAHAAEAHAAPTHAAVVPAAAAVTAGGPVTVTLITGDQVTVDGHGGTSVTRAAGRAGIEFVTQVVDGDQYVTPADALPLLRSGRLDRRLFDVTELRRFGYDDRAAALPLLVSYPRASERTAARSAATVAGVQVVRDLSMVGTLAVRADRASRPALWRSLTATAGGAAAARTLTAGVDRVWLDGKRTVSLDVSVPQIGAPVAWKAGLNGAGVTVAVLDTGVDDTHPDLATQIVGEQNFTTTASTDDTVGHGTHVASIIAGTGAASAGQYTGVAPGAKLLIGKVCGDTNCAESDILAGMAWAAPRARVVNMSLGGPDTAGIDPLEQAVNDLTARYDCLFVIAAGNDGTTAPVGSPASADAALAVAAVDADDQLAAFSSRGPRVGDHAVKPDIAAPGVNIVAARAAHGTIGTPAANPAYTSLSGTSMATPHVAGAAAILAQEHPGWSELQLKTALMASAKATDGMTVFGEGAGRVDVARAITQTVTVDGGSVSFGRQAYPHTDDTPIVKTVTYRNDGPDPVTLSLSAHAAETGVPTGAFTVGSTTLTVPAGGTAATTLTADTALAGPDGYWTGYLTATATGGVQVQTPFAVDREKPGFDLSLAYVGRSGAPAAVHYSTFVNLDTYEAVNDWTTDPVPVVHLTAGRWGIFSWIYGPDTDPTRSSSTFMVQPAFVVDRAETLQIDARTAGPISVTVPTAGAAPTLIAMNASWSGPPGKGNGAATIAGGFAGQYVGQIWPGVAAPEFLGSVTTSFAAVTAGSIRNSPYVYDLAWAQRGAMFTGLTRAPKPADLSTFDSSYARAGALGVDGMAANGGRLAAGDSYWTVYVPFDLPFHRTEYVNADAGMQWSSTFAQRAVPAGGTYPVVIYQQDRPAAGYAGGRTYQRQWNRAVFGPSLANPATAANWVTRSGDVITAGVPMYADGNGVAGVSALAGAHLALYRGTALVGEVDAPTGQFTVPAGPATYRLTATVSRGAGHTLSTSVTDSWTFRSQHVTGDTPRRLPLSVVRFSPRLDDLNAAPAGRLFDIPLDVQAQPNAPAGRPLWVTVQVSYDDGTTWHPALVRGSGSHRVATVRHPAGAGYASLRVSATDTTGETVTQTVIRAYAIG